MAAAKADCPVNMAVVSHWKLNDPIEPKAVRFQKAL